MSMRSYFVNGFGFATDAITDANIIRFIKNHIDNGSYTSILYEDEIKIIKNISEKDIADMEAISPDFISTQEFAEKYEELVDTLNEPEKDIADVEAISPDFISTQEFAEKYEELVNTLNELSDFDITYTRCLDIVAKLIGWELSIHLSFQYDNDDCIGVACIMLPQCMPWNYTETERQLTQEQFCEYLEPYLTELGIGDHECEDLEVEYYG